MSDDLNLKRFYRDRIHKTVADRIQKAREAGYITTMQQSIKKSMKKHGNPNQRDNKRANDFSLYEDTINEDGEEPGDGEASLNSHWLENEGSDTEEDTDEAGIPIPRPLQVHTSFRRLTLRGPNSKHRSNIFKPSSLLSYNITAPGAVTSPTETRGLEDLTAIISTAILSKQFRYARTLITEASMMRSKGHANIILNAALLAAAQLNDAIFIQFILSLETNDGVNFLEMPIYTATTNANHEIVGMHVPRLMHTRDGAEITIHNLCTNSPDKPNSFRALAEDAQITAQLALHRACLVAHSFEHASQKNYNTVRRLLFEPIRVLAHQATTGTDAVAVLTSLAKQTYFKTFTRKQRLSLLIEPRLPHLLHCAISLTLDEHTPRFSEILTGPPNAEGVRSYPVHWDVLVFHSRYFEATSQIAGAPLVTPENVDDNIMRLLMGWMYTGEIDIEILGTRPQAREELFNLWDTAEPENLDLPELRGLCRLMLGMFVGSDGDVQDVEDRENDDGAGSEDEDEVEFEDVN
ncbi:hypothetical protein BDW74DRAFT_175563 [Aspergillus multicolor]|uniref:uncharacterized protein n=1 Tax=Aspergillus multicolor TaxID=41759 RepID=UPI003CCD2A0E